VAGVFLYVECDVGHVRRADLATVAALARACVNSKRLGARLRVVNAAPELDELLGFVGLDEVLLGRRRRQPEQGEETLRVEERGVADDPSV
jgi:anti-anti-sigma regulatory factor